jgi:hypothetical protein
MSFSPFSSLTAPWNYTYTLELHDTVHVVPCTVNETPRMASRISLPVFAVNYTVAQGTVQGQDEWHVLGVSPDRRFLLIYYCGSSPMGDYQGAIIMGRDADADMPADVLQYFSQALVAANVKVTLNTFCHNDNNHCRPV